MTSLIYGYEAVVRLLLDTGEVDADSRDKDGLTPLWWATESGYDVVVKRLLDTGKVGANSKDKGGQTPLSRAARGHEAVVKLLVERDDIEANPKENQCGASTGACI